MPVDRKDVIDYGPDNAQNQRELNRVGGSMVDPIAFLTAALTNEAASYEGEAVKRTQQSSVAIEDLLQGPGARSYNDQIADQQQPASSSPVIRNATVNAPLDDTYLNVIKRIPKGTNFNWKTSPNVKATVEQATGDTLLYVEKQQKTDPYKVAAAEVQAMATKGPERFNVNDLLEKAKTLTGDDLTDYIVTATAQIEMQSVREMQRIREAAATESGYTYAQAALSRNIALDMASPHYQVYQTPSAQTTHVQGIVNAARAQMDGLIHGLAISDSAIAELNNAKKSLLTIEAKRADRQQRKSDKYEMAMASVTPTMIKNYKFLTNPELSDEDAALAIVKNKDKPINKLVQITPENIWVALADPDAYVRNGALKIVLEHEKATDAMLRDSGATTSPLTTLLKAAQDKEQMLVDLLPKKERDQWTIDMIKAAPKEKAELRAKLYSQYLPKLVEDRLSNVFLGNTKVWTAPEAAAGTELGKVIDAVAKTDPKHNAPIGSVIEQFMTREMKKADGTPLGLDEKVSILDSAFRNQANSLKRNMIITPEMVAGVETQMASQIRNFVARAKTAILIAQYREKLGVLPIGPREEQFFGDIR